jgi:hypothetical protein
MMMNRLLAAAAGALALAAAPAVAQDRPLRPADVGKVTVVGCVERADQILSRENLGTTADSLTFVLVKAEEGKASDQPTAAPRAGEQDGGTTYRLDVDVDTINPHVGHRVEITATRPANAPVGTAGRSDAEPSATAVPPPLLKVESVKMISSTCGR